MGPVVPPDRSQDDERSGPYERPRRQASSGAVTGRQGPRGVAAERSDVVVGSRLRRRRTLSRSSAPPRALADEGAGVGGRGAAREREGPRYNSGAAERKRPGARNRSHLAGRREDEAHTDADRPGPEP